MGAMPQATAELHDLPEEPASVVAGFIDAAREAFGDDLRSVVLYGSGAEGRLRPSSDINLLLILRTFAREKVNGIRGQFSEIKSAGELFAQKFSDILRRHRLLYGSDPFSGVSIPKSAVLWRLKQVLLNLTLRLREAYAERGATPERVSALIADAAGPLRSCAATMLVLEGKPASHPKEALASIVASLGEPGWYEVLAHISEAREREFLAPDVAEATLFRLIDLAQRLRARVEALT